MAPLELQSLQQYEFEATKKTVFYSVISVLRSSGYTIGEADLKTGLITASGLLRSTRLHKFFEPTLDLSSETKITAFIESLEGEGIHTRVRLNFVIVTYQKDDQKSGVEESVVLAPNAYKSIFEQISIAILVRT